MDMKYTCPKCKQRKWKLTKKKNKLKCVAPYCSYVSEEMSSEKLEEILNYVPEPPTAIELAMYDIREELDLDWDDEKRLEKILTKYFGNESNNNLTN